MGRERDRDRERKGVFLVFVDVGSRVTTALLG